MKAVMLKYYAFLPLLLLCSFYAYKAIEFPIHDFANYYFGGTFLADGQFNSDVYFPYEFNKAISDLGHKNIFASYAPNTPFLAVLFLAFTVFSVAAAKLIFNSISIFLLVFSLIRLFNHYKIDIRYALLLPILFLVPIKNNLLFGQVYFLLFFLLSEGWLAYEKKQWKSMAIFWSLAILLKVFPMLLIALLLFRKQWKATFYLAIAGLFLFGISLFFTRLDIWIFYLKEVLPKASNGEIATAFVPNYQSVFMFLKELLVYDVTENPNAFFNYPILFAAMMVAFKTFILVVGYFVSQKVSNAIMVCAYWISAMIILSPYGSTYTFILLLFLFLALLKSPISMAKKVVFFGLLFLINNVPLSLFIENAFPLSYFRLFLLLLFFGLFISLFYKNINWKIVTVFSLVPMILILIFKKNENLKSTILLKEGPILMYDYEIKTNSEINYYFMTASFWDGIEKKVFWKPQIQTFQLLNLKNNQVFYKNQQLTFDKSNKLKPMLINNKTIIYLSDYDRGIGFYTLRKINLR